MLSTYSTSQNSLQKIVHTRVRCLRKQNDELKKHPDLYHRMPNQDKQSPLMEKDASPAWNKINKIYNCMCEMKKQRWLWKEKHIFWWYIEGLTTDVAVVSLHNHLYKMNDCSELFYSVYQSHFAAKYWVDKNSTRQWIKCVDFRLLYTWS